MGRNSKGNLLKIEGLKVLCQKRKHMSKRRSIEYLCLLEDRSVIQVHAADIHANLSKEFITKCKGSSCFLPLPIGSSEVRGLGGGQAAIDSAETCKTSSSAVQDDLNETPTSGGSI